jgi:hypothetical protein
MVKYAQVSRKSMLFWWLISSILLWYSRFDEMTKRFFFATSTIAIDNAPKDLSKQD